MKFNAKDLIQKGYVLNELPPIFTSSVYADNYSIIFPQNSLRQISRGDNSSSECTYYSIPKAGYNRRILGLPNPLHYTLLVQTLENKSAEIAKYLNSSISCSLPVIDVSNKRAVTQCQTFSDFRRKGFLRSSGTFYNLKLDISRYYQTIYTHIIPWALHGRNIAKARTHDMNLLGNLLDAEVRNLQSKQTMGIPIGPDTSLIISELIGCSLDKELVTRFPNIKAVRYVDDYSIYVSSRSDAEEVLKFMQTLLSNYLLAPNEDKTLVKEFPFNTDPEWIISLRSLKAICFKDSTGSEQEGDIRQFFSSAFDWAEKYPKDEVMKFAARILFGIPISSVNWDYYEAWLLKMGLYDPYTLPEICKILHSNVNLVSKKSLKVFAHELLEKHIAKRHSFEICWTLWITKIFKIRISNKIASELFNSNDPIPTLMALDLINSDLISKKTSIKHIKLDLTADSLRDGRWILAYEAVMKGWIYPSAKNKNFIEAHPFFSKLFKNKISFYDENAVITSSEEVRSFKTDNIKALRDFWGNHYWL